MKKIGMLIVFFIGISILSGCVESKKDLTCSYDMAEDGSSKVEYVLTFDKKEDKLNSYVLRTVQSYDDNATEEEFTKEYDEAMKTCDIYKDMKGVKCDATKEKKSFKVELTVDLMKLDAAGQEALATFLLEDTTYENTKTRMESSEFKCK